MAAAATNPNDIKLKQQRRNMTLDKQDEADDEEFESESSNSNCQIVVNHTTDPEFSPFSSSIKKKTNLYTPSISIEDTTTTTPSVDNTISHITPCTILTQANNQIVPSQASDAAADSLQQSQQQANESNNNNIPLVPLTNIIEDEEDVTCTVSDLDETIDEEVNNGSSSVVNNNTNNRKQNTQEIVGNSQQMSAAAPRRCSRGGGTAMDSQLASLTIPEEVETEHRKSQKSLFGSQSIQSHSPSPLLSTSQYNDNNNDEYDDANNKEDAANRYNFDSVDAKQNHRDYESDPILPLRNNNNNSNSNKTKLKMFRPRTDSSSDNSDSEMKKKQHLANAQASAAATISTDGVAADKTDIADANWNRTASSSSSRSRHKFRSNSNHLTNGNIHNIDSENDMMIRHRPLSISEAGTYSKEDSNNNNSNKMTSRTTTESLTKPMLLHHHHNHNHHYNQHNQQKQSLPASVANSNDQLNSMAMMPQQLAQKTLSIEHRMANMSQMSISSQLSKNNSVRFFANSSSGNGNHQHSSANMMMMHRNGSYDDNASYHSNNATSSNNNNNNHNFFQSHSSTTPTPRESIVFKRGDDKPPIAKILLSNRSMQNDFIIKESAEITNKLIELSNRVNRGFDDDDDNDEENTNGNGRKDDEQDEEEDERTVVDEAGPISINNEKDQLDLTRTTTITNPATATTTTVAANRSVNINNNNAEMTIHGLIKQQELINVDEGNNTIRHHNASYSSAINNGSKSDVISRMVSTDLEQQQPVSPPPSEYTTTYHQIDGIDNQISSDYSVMNSNVFLRNKSLSNIVPSSQISRKTSSDSFHNKLSTTLAAPRPESDSVVVAASYNNNNNNKQYQVAGKPEQIEEKCMNGNRVGLAGVKTASSSSKKMSCHNCCTII